MNRRLAGLVAAAALMIAGVDALELEITDADLRRANALARGDRKSLEAFHRPYVFPVSAGDLQDLEVLTELRRAVLWASDPNRIAEPQTAAVRRLQQMLAPHRGRVSVVARFRFSPQTALVTLPHYDLTVAAAGGLLEARPVDVQRSPTYTVGRGTFLAGAEVEAVFEALRSARPDAWLR